MGKREQMSRKLDAWLGRGFKASKLKSLLNLTVSRLAVLRNQRRARCDLARRDVADLLGQGHQERALFRADYVIKEQNMLDVFAMVESYCHLVAERANLLENQRDCPDELREAIAGLVFAESRCGELPELREVRSILAARLGKELVASAVELRNNCGVNPRIIQKLSTRQPSLDNRIRVTREIAAEAGVSLHIQEPSSEIAMEEEPRFDQQPAEATDGLPASARDQYLSESVKMRDRYKDAASAAQAAFESAAYAAAAARAAVELSRSESQDRGGSGDWTGPLAPSGGMGPRADPSMSIGPAFEKAHPGDSCSSESESELEVEPEQKPVQLPGEGKHAPPPLSSTDDLLRRWEKMVAYDTGEEEEESEENGSRAPGSVGRSGHGSRVRRQLGKSSDEGTSDDEELEEINPGATGLRRRNPALVKGNWENPQHVETHQAGLRYMEEDEAGHGERFRGGNFDMAAAGSLPVHRLGMRTSFHEDEEKCVLVWMPEADHRGQKSWRSAGGRGEEEASFVCVSS